MKISEVKAIVVAIGSKWFSEETMKLFGTKIETGESIETVGKFQQYKTKESAREAARKY